MKYGKQFLAMNRNGKMCRKEVRCVEIPEYPELCLTKDSKNAPVTITYKLTGMSFTQRFDKYKTRLEYVQTHPNVIQSILSYAHKQDFTGYLKKFKNAPIITG